MAHTFTNIIYHFVFSTKERMPLILENHKEDLYRYIKGIIGDLRGHVHAIGGTDNHIHICCELKTDVAVSEVMRQVKGSSSRWLNEKSTDLKFNWQEGYSVFSVSQSVLPAVVKYIENQEEHHRQRSFKEELVMILEKHHIEYDERFFLG